MPADTPLYQLKPALSLPQQIAHLKACGVTFARCSEAEAAAYLTDKSYFYKLLSYRRLFARRIGGARDGEYVGLDFGYLVELSSLDRTLRYTLLPLTLDIEHFARVKLMREAMAHSEDGYTIVADYLASLVASERARRERELSILGHDPYLAGLVQKYSQPGTMPLWVYLELCSFGTFIDLYRFCARRWEDRAMRDEHYLLRQVKSCRNAAAHSTNMISCFGKTQGTSVAAIAPVTKALIQLGMSKHMRTTKMHNPCLRQITTTLYLHTQMVSEGTSYRRARKSLVELKPELKIVREDLADNDTVRSSLDFLILLLDNWF